MRLTTLGGLALDGSDFGRAKPLLLLCYLALEGSKDRHHLAELFWPGAADPLNSLAAALKQLRRYAPGAAVSDHVRVSSALECDATTFLQVANAGHYEEALELYQGPFLSGVYLPGWGAEVEEWVYGTREFLAGRARRALMSLGEDEAAGGNYEQAARYGDAAYTLAGAPELEPEEVTRLHALLAAGDSPHLGRLRKDAREFGVELSLSLAAPREQPQRPLDSSPAPGRALPTRGTTFVGRDAELIEVANQLARPECSLLTLTGPGGVGKTRLAVRVAHDLRESYPGGVHFVPLEALSSANLIPASIASAIGLTLQGGDDPLSQVSRHVGDKTVLLVLDNYEHLLEGASVAAQLTRACPSLKLLVTSRERLNLEEEWVLPLEGLAVPSRNVPLDEVPRHDAVKLFAERAKRSRLSFELTQQDLPHVVSVCDQVEGLPLGVELAAAWVRTFSCEEIAHEIERTVDFLESPTRNVPERHRSVRAVFEGSWRLLGPNEQRVLRRLSVFRGGFRREAAAEVAGATIPVLASLVDKSLLSVTARGRYDFHPLIQQYTKEKLAQDDRELTRVQARHAGFFLRMADEAEPQLLGPQQTLWFDRLEEEHDNLRSATAWAQETGNVRSSLKASGALFRFWEFYGHAKEGREYIARALARAGAKQETFERAKALMALGVLTSHQGGSRTACSLLEQSIDLYQKLGDGRGAATSMLYLASARAEQGDYRSARTLLETGLTEFRSVQDRWGVAWSLAGLGQLARVYGDYTLAGSLLKESLAMRKELGDRWGVAQSLTLSGGLQQYLGDFSGARQHFEEALTVQREFKNRVGTALSLLNLGRISLREGDYPSARRWLDESRQLFDEDGDRTGGSPSRWKLWATSLRRRGPMRQPWFAYRRR